MGAPDGDADGTMLMVAEAEGLAEGKLLEGAALWLGWNEGSTDGARLKEGTTEGYSDGAKLVLGLLEGELDGS